MDEQEATDNLEVLCGGIERAFRLMQIYSAAKTKADYQARRRNSIPLSRVFKQAALKEGYSPAAISAYLDYV